MAVGLGVLQLPPSAFWAMTPRELDHAARAFRPQHPAPLERNELSALMKRFPDFIAGE